MVAMRANCMHQKPVSMVEDRGMGLTQINHEQGFHSNKKIMADQHEIHGRRMLLISHIG